MTYRDVPEGYTVVPESVPQRPQAAPKRYRDVPEGYTVVDPGFEAQPQTQPQEAVPLPRYRDVPEGYTVVPESIQPAAPQVPPTAAVPEAPQEPAPQPTATGKPMSSWDEFWAAEERSWYRPGAATGARILGGLTGLSDDATIAADIAKNEQARRALPQSEAFKRKQETGEWFNLPNIAAGAGEQVGNLAELLGAAAPGLLAGPVGALATGATVAGLQETSGAFVEYMQQQGIDVGDEAQIMAFLADPQKRKDATIYAMIRGGTIGAFVGAAGGVGGKVLPWLVGKGLPGKIATVPTTLAIGGTEEAASEATADILTGQPLSGQELGESFILGSLFGVPEVALPAVVKGLKSGVDAVLPTEEPVGPPEPDWSKVKIDPATGTPDLSALAQDIDKQEIQEILYALDKVRAIPDVTQGAASSKAAFLTRLKASYDLEQQAMPAWLMKAVADVKMGPTQPFQKTGLYEQIAGHFVNIRQDPNQGITQPMTSKSLMPDVLIDDPTQPNPVRLKVDEGTARDGSPVLLVNEVIGEVTPAAMDRFAQFLGNSGYKYMALPENMLADEADLRKQGLKVERQTIDESFGGKSERLIALTPNPEPDPLPTTAFPASSVTTRPPRGVAPIPKWGQAPIGTGPVQIASPQGAAFSLRRTHTPDEIAAVTQKILEIGKKFSNIFKLSKPLEFKIDQTANDVNLGEVNWGDPSKYVMTVWPNNSGGETQLFATVMHELGHIVLFDHFLNATPITQLSILEEYGRFRQNVEAMESKIGMRNLLGVRQNRGSPGEFLGGQFLGWRGANPLKRIASSEYVGYWNSFPEWFANSTAKWATSRARPITLVESFFSALARKLQRVLDRLAKWAGISLEPGPAMTIFLESFMLNTNPELFRQAFKNTLQATQASSQNALNATGASGVTAVPQSVQSLSILGSSLPVLSGNSPQMRQARLQLRANAAHADKINKFWKSAAGLVQLARMNPDVPELHMFKELIELAQNEIVGIQNRGVATLQVEKGLGHKQHNALIDSLDDYVMMTFRSQQEQNNKVVRMPTQAELTAIFKKNDLKAKGQAIFHRMVADYQFLLGKIEEMLVAEAMKITDPVKQLTALQGVQKQIAAMRADPYIPLMRFGTYTVTVRNASGKREDWMPYSIVESRAEQKRLQKQYQKEYGDVFPGVIVVVGEIPKIAQPLVGLPPNLLTSIKNKLNLNPTQLEVLDDLVYELSPAQSFRHRLQKRSRTPGYSRDFTRSYAQYFLHAANYITRVKYRDALEAQVKALDDKSKVTPGWKQGKTRSMLVAYMRQHLADWHAPEGDFWRLKAAAFFVFLGYGLKSAFANLTSLSIATYPFLAKHFGDVKTVAAMARASSSRGTYFRKATLDKAFATAPMQKILKELYESGSITESFGQELAGYGENRNLVKKYFGGYVSQGWHHFVSGGAYLFSMAEQANRRVTGMATVLLTLQNPNAPYVLEMVKQNRLQYDRLIQQGWNPLHARAVVTAKAANEDTQGVYSSWGRAPFMKGKKGAVFMFKGWQQQYLFMLWNNPGTIPRSLLVMAFLGGLTGIPLYDDIRDLIKLTARLFFGRYFDIEHWARELLIDWTKGFAGEEGAEDLTEKLLYGTSRTGFGLSTLFNYMGVPIPEVDLSSSVGFGPVNPAPLSPVFARGTEEAFMEAAKGVAGIPFSMIFNAADAIHTTASRLSGTGFSLPEAIDQAIGDPVIMNAWLKVIPRFASMATKSYWAAQEGGIMSNQSDRVIKFDPEDTLHTAELFGIAAGFNPTRLSQAWEKRAWDAEVNIYWDTRRSLLLSLFAEAVRRQDPDLIEQNKQAVIKYNSELPQELKLKAIEPEDVDRSIQQRTERRFQREAGVSPQESERPLSQKLRELFPDEEEPVIQPMPH